MQGLVTPQILCQILSRLWNVANMIYVHVLVVWRLLCWLGLSESNPRRVSYIWWSRRPMSITNLLISHYQFQNFSLPIWQNCQFPILTKLFPILTLLISNFEISTPSTKISSFNDKKHDPYFQSWLSDYHYENFQFWYFKFRNFRSACKAISDLQYGSVVLQSFASYLSETSVTIWQQIPPLSTELTFWAELKYF